MPQLKVESLYCVKYCRNSKSIPARTGACVACFLIQKRGNRATCLTIPWRHPHMFEVAEASLVLTASRGLQQGAHVGPAVTQSRIIHCLWHSRACRMSCCLVSDPLLESASACAMVRHVPPFAFEHTSAKGLRKWRGALQLTPPAPCRLSHAENGWLVSSRLHELAAAIQGVQCNEPSRGS